MQKETYQILNARRKRARQTFWSHLTKPLLYTSSYFPCFNPVPPVFSYSLTLLVHNLNLNETHLQFGRADAEGMTAAEAYGRRRIFQKINSYGWFFFPATSPELPVAFDQMCPESCAVFYLFIFLFPGIAFWSSNTVNGIHFACNEAAAPTSCCLACVSSLEEDARAGINLH